MRTNTRVGALIWRDGQLLILHRFKNGSEYWVLPGGGVESQETNDQALKREILEETGLGFTSPQLLTRSTDDNGTRHLIYQIHLKPGIVQLGGPEAKKQNPANQYHFEWVTPPDFLKLNPFFPRIAQTLVKP